jgi:rare lipoprotein A (peptidoglycan hydrolase)
VRADRGLLARRAGVLLAVATVAGIGVALGCASKAADVRDGEGRLVSPAPGEARAPRPKASEASEDSEGSEVSEAGAVVRTYRGRASYYGKEFNWKRTASGERYNPHGMTAAHKTLPFGTRIRVTRPGGPSVVVRVNDRCGCTHGRIVDVSEAAARKLNMMRTGVVPVRLEVLR